MYDLDTRSAIKSHFYSLFLLRRFFFSLVVVVMHTHPLAQWQLIALQQVGVSEREVDSVQAVLWHVIVQRRPGISTLLICAFPPPLFKLYNAVSKAFCPRALALCGRMCRRRRRPSFVRAQPLNAVIP